MKFLGNLLARRRRRRRIKAAKALKTSLREFVYLDEVSVYSLLASRQGALASEYTHTETSSVTGSVESEVGGGVGVLSADVSTKSESSQSRSTQVLRKSSVQAAFKELHEVEEGRLAFSILSQGEVPPSVTTWDEVEKALGTALLDNWVIDPMGLARGQLIEIEIELQADKVFRFAAISAAIRDIIQENPQGFGSELYANIQSIEAVNRVLDRLLVGLIPLRCRAVDFMVVTLKGKKFLVHRRLLEHLTDRSARDGEDLYIVGVAEERLFWKDVRRILFSGSRFRAMCRLNHESLRDKWVPVKLVDVLGTVVPQLAEQIDELVVAAFASSGKDAPEDDTELQHRLNMAVIDYGISLAQQYHADVSEEELVRNVIALRVPHTGHLDVESRRDFFSSMTRYICDRLQIDPDPTTLARLRTAAMLDAGLGLDGSVRVDARASSDSAHDEKTSSMIDTEVVAIYW